MEAICADLQAEHQSLDDYVAKLDENRWSLSTPADGWSIRDQISHLWFFDQRAAMALRDADEFAADTERLIAAGGTAGSVVAGRAMTGTDLLAQWRADRASVRPNHDRLFRSQIDSEDIDLTRLADYSCHR